MLGIFDPRVPAISNVDYDQQNEIDREKRDVDSVTEVTEPEGTTFVPFSDRDAPLPSTPFPRPDADYNYPTVNPIPEDFNPSNLTDIDLSSGFIQNSRASCRKLKYGQETPWFKNLC